MLLICEHVINPTAPLRSVSGVLGAGAQLPVEQELSQGTGTASQTTPSLVNKNSQKREIAQTFIPVPVVGANGKRQLKDIPRIAFKWKQTDIENLTAQHTSHQVNGALVMQMMYSSHHPCRVVNKKSTRLP